MDRIFQLLSDVPWYINLITIPLLLVVVFVGLFLVLKPQNKNYLSKLYSLISEMHEIAKDSCNAKTIKILIKKMRYALNCCDFLMGGEMYEIENVVASLNKASNILIAMQVAKIGVESYGDYLPRVNEQLEHSKHLISSFYMEDTVSELKYNSLNPRKNRQSAKDYLDDIK